MNPPAARTTKPAARVEKSFFGVIAMSGLCEEAIFSTVVWNHWQ
jgi:hypothetical protein